MKTDRNLLFAQLSFMSADAIESTTKTCYRQSSEWYSCE